MGRYDALTELEKGQKQQEAQKPQSTSIQQDSRNPEIKNSRNMDTQKSSNPDYQKLRNQEFQKSSNQDLGNPSKREFYTKATYRLCDEALDAIDDAKKVLKRRYQLKVNLEEIVETAVLAAYHDLEENGEKSLLVTTYSRNPEIKNS